MDFINLPEQQSVTDQIAAHYKEILRLLGEDVEREGLIKTPQRVAKAMQFITQGYYQKPEEILRSAIFHEDYHQMVLVKDIEFYSMCEHHMLPFFGKVHVAYIPNGKVVGLSKLARTVEVFAKRPQIQEQLTEQIADALMEYLKPQGAIVMMEAEHMCMTMRGIKKTGSKTVTFSMKGVFEENEALVNRFLTLVKNN